MDRYFGWSADLLIGLISACCVLWGAAYVADVSSVTAVPKIQDRLPITCQDIR